jgi:AcrR family transcriptional regulator
MGEKATDRGARRRAETRARLAGAARELFARQGVEPTRINEITEQADVGFGSFYNHFDSKEAIVDAVIADVLTEQGAAIEAMTRDLDDPAEVIAVAHRHLIGQAVDDATWGWLAVRLAASYDIVLVSLGDYARRDLQRGIASRRFDVPDPDLALEQSGGMLLAAMRATLEGRADRRTAARHHAAGVLRLLGLSRADATKVSSRPLPGS